MIVDCLLIWIQDKGRLFFRIVYETCCKKKDFQYICTINEDALESFEGIMSTEDYKKYC